MLSLMLLAMNVVSAVGAPDCAVLQELVAAEQRCIDTPHGIVIAASEVRARDLAAIASAGEVQFTQRFGRSAPRYAVVETATAGIDPTMDSALAARGFAWRLPWLSQAGIIEGYRASITRAVRAKAAALGLPPARQDAMVAAALAQQSDRLSPATLTTEEAGTLPHELGHGWFIRSYWPSAAIAKGNHYGGPAPDWMDETAAVMMEDDALATRRRAQFAALYHGADRAMRDRLIDLTSFLSGDHPGLAAIDMKGMKPGVNVMTGDDAARVAAIAGMFYLQARLFADYVIDRSGDPAAFASAGQAFAAGHTTEEWLARSSARLHVPKMIAAMQRDWETWLVGRLPKSM